MNNGGDLVMLLVFVVLLPLLNLTPSSHNFGASREVKFIVMKTAKINPEVRSI